jgi:hypothetical protein
MPVQLQEPPEWRLVIPAVFSSKVGHMAQPPMIVPVPDCGVIAPLSKKQCTTQPPTQNPVGSGVGFEVAGAGSDQSRMAADAYRPTHQP